MIDEKIFFAIERIHTATRSALQHAAQEHKLSPLQAQILNYIDHREAANVSDLASYFRVSKPTVSDSVSTLITKGFVTKAMSKHDARGSEILLTEAGEQEVRAVDSYASPFLISLEALSDEQKKELWGALVLLIKTMEQQGLISHTRMCFSCGHYVKAYSEKKDYCKFMESPLGLSDLRLDCSEHFPPGKN